METITRLRFSVRDNDLIAAALEDYADAAHVLNSLDDADAEETRLGVAYLHAVEAEYAAAEDALHALLDAHCAACVRRAIEEQLLAELSPLGDTEPTPAAPINAAEFSRSLKRAQAAVAEQLAEGAKTLRTMRNGRN